MIKNKNKNKKTKIIMKAIIKSKRTFGIEIEFNARASRAQIAELLNKKVRNSLIQDESYNHRTQAYWKLITDSSCGYELVSPPLKGNKGLTEMYKILKALNNAPSDFGVRVDISCGVHVHVDVNDLNYNQIGNVVKLYARASEQIDKVLSPSRRRLGDRGQRWAQNLLDCVHGRDDKQRMISLWNSVSSCNKSSNSVADNVRDLANRFGGRYKAVNLTSYRAYGTIEFRQHQGTTHPEKIWHWVVFLTRLVDLAKSKNGRIINRTKPTFHQVFGSSKQVHKFFSERAVGFGFEEAKIEEKELSVKSSLDIDNKTIQQMSDNSIRILIDGVVSLGNVKGFLKTIALNKGISIEGMNTRRLGREVIRNA